MTLAPDNGGWHTSGGSRVLVAPIRPGGSPETVGVPAAFAVGLTGLAICCLPLLQPGLPGNGTPADIAMGASMLGVMVWAGTMRARIALPYAAGVSVLAVGGLVSSLASGYPGIGLISVTQDLFLLGWAAALATVARSPHAFDVLARTWVVSSLLWAVAFIVATTSETVSAGNQSVRAGFTFGEQNGAGLYFSLSLFIVIATKRPRAVALRVGAGALLALATLYTGSLGALSGLLLGLAVGIVLAVRSKRGPVPALGLGLAIVLAAASMILLAQKDNVVRIASTSENSLIRNSIGRGDQSASEREVLSAETLQLRQAAGLMGLGPASTKDVLLAGQAPYPKEAHDDWVATLVERGLIGGLGLLLLVVEIGMRAARCWDPRRLLLGFQVVLPAAGYLTGALGVLALFSVTHEVLHDRTAWTLFAFIAAVSLWGQPQQQGGST